jgi:hypothetical protein
MDLLAALSANSMQHHGYFPAPWMHHATPAGSRFDSHPLHAQLSPFASAAGRSWPAPQSMPRLAALAALADWAASNDHAAAAAAAAAAATAPPWFLPPPAGFPSAGLGPCAPACD